MTLILKIAGRAAHASACYRGLLLAFVVLANPMGAQAQNVQETLYDVYSISSEASVEVDNDRMVATLAVQEEDKDAAVLANRVNASMSWATNVLRPFNSIAVKTRDYQTSPRYDNSGTRRLTGWSARQIIELETDDFAAAGKAIQALQEKLKVQNIKLSVKPETREKASDVLIENALNSFKERARLVQSNMNSTSFRILDVDVRTQQNSPSHGNNMMMRSESAVSAVVETAPAIVGGVTTVNVQIRGRIQLD